MKIILTGGAGFIGSNLAKSLLQDKRVSALHIIDNLSNGSLDNLKTHLDHPKLNFHKMDIRDIGGLNKIFKGADVVNHQAALGSVPRSVKDPITTNEVNIGGTLNVFKAAVDQGVKRVVFASSSSVYGDQKDPLKIEKKTGIALSPYAVTKQVTELYAKAFALNYRFEYIGLRYFNIFGPFQSPQGPYAAVIPLFCEALLSGKNPEIFGDGLQSRDFTYVENAVQANNNAIFTQNKEAVNQFYNIACGERTTLLELVSLLEGVGGKKTSVSHLPERKGDIKHSLADINKAKELLGYQVALDIREGLKYTYNWYKNQYAKNKK